MLKFTVMVLSLLFVTACNTTKSMHVPSAPHYQYSPVKIPEEEQASFVLKKIIVNLKRGATIAHYPSPMEFNHNKVKGSSCNYHLSGQNTLNWGAGSSRFGNWSSELGEVFHEVMSGQGYNVAGDPSNLFEEIDNANAAEYSIGARVTEIRGNICEDYDQWWGRPTGLDSAEMYMVVEWSIYSNLQKRQLLNISTKGYGLQANPVNSGAHLALYNAFANASEGLAASQKFKKIMVEDRQQNVTPIVTGQRLTLAKVTEKNKPIENNLETTLASVVTVRAGSGHGSGFAISHDGYILTNAHVVASAKNVTIRLNNGLELPGEVINVNKPRDVALIKIPLRFPNALPLRNANAKPLENVYVIGSPADETLQSTITRGIVSAIRKDDLTGLPLIQSDAAISGGNSGGPMLDENGNVIAISVSKLVSGNAENIGFFIPIHDAMKYLNLSF